MKNKKFLLKNRWQNLILIFICLLSVKIATSQEVCHSIIFRAKTELSKPIANSLSTMNVELNQILSDYQVTSLLQARPDGKTQKVRDLYEYKDFRQSKY